MSINRSKPIRPMIALALIVLSTVGTVSAAPNLNNVDVEEPQAEVIVETDRSSDTTKAEERVEPLTWRDNPNDCTDKQWIAKEPPYKCINKPTKTPDSQQAKSVGTKVSGNKETWLRSSGIPESDWWAVDYIVSKESSWNPFAINKSSGACGLAQALPCSKIPGDWSNPVTALKWQYEYVKGRYGGYAQAYEFWVSNHWY